MQGTQTSRPTAPPRPLEPEIRTWLEPSRWRLPAVLGKWALDPAYRHLSRLAHRSPCRWHAVLLSGGGGLPAAIQRRDARLSASGVFGFARNQCSPSVGMGVRLRSESALRPGRPPRYRPKAQCGRRSGGRPRRDRGAPASLRCRGTVGAGGVSQESSQPPDPNRILRRREVEHRTSLSRTTLWRMMRRGEFPRHLQLSANRIGWLEADIENWIQGRARAPS